MRRPLAAPVRHCATGMMQAQSIITSTTTIIIIIAIIAIVVVVGERARPESCRWPAVEWRASSWMKEEAPEVCNADQLQASQIHSASLAALAAEAQTNGLCHSGSPVRRLAFICRHH